MMMEKEEEEEAAGRAVDLRAVLRTMMMMM